MRSTHIKGSGEAHMVDVGDKPSSARVAVAEGLVNMSSELVSMLFAGDLPKGDAVAVARVAGITGAKKTPELVPLCHPIPLGGVEVDIEPVDGGVRVVSRVSTNAQTGVEMEALTAVSTACLTIYDMVKGVERGVTIESVRLLEKSGGRSGRWVRSEVVE